jgi:hypothetical protein
MLIQYMAENSKNYIFSLLTVVVITTAIITSLLNLFSFRSLFNDNTTTLLTTSAFAQNSNDSGSTIIRGGGIGSITCPDGSSNKAVIAFVVSGNGSRGKISTTNWNINELPSGQNSVPGFVSGEFNSVILKSGNYKITGQKINETHFCQPPVSVPITISGSCNQNVVINVRFESNDPILSTGGSFTGDVTCSQNTINK